MEVLIDAYIGARYLPREYRRDVVERPVELVGEFLRRYVEG